MNWKNLKNPIFESSDNLRDPAVFKVGDAWHLYYTRYSNADWYRAENWSVARVMTKDWIQFYDDRDVIPKGYASPGDLVFWHGRWILPYESYPIHPSGLYFSQSSDQLTWSEPEQFLSEALQLPWNTYARAGKQEEGQWYRPCQDKGSGLAGMGNSQHGPSPFRPKSCVSRWG